MSEPVMLACDHCGKVIGYGGAPGAEDAERFRLGCEQRKALGGIPLHEQCVVDYEAKRGGVLKMVPLSRARPEAIDLVPGKMVGYWVPVGSRG